MIVNFVSNVKYKKGPNAPAFFAGDEMVLENCIAGKQQKTEKFCLLCVKQIHSQGIIPLLNKCLVC